MKCVLFSFVFPGGIKLQYVQSRFGVYGIKPQSNDSDRLGSANSHGSLSQ